VSEANPRTTEDSTLTLRGHDEWPTAPAAVTHPLRRPRNVAPDTTVGALRRAALVETNPSGRTTSDLSTRLIDPHPPRFAPYTGPDRRRHRAITPTNQARRRTDLLYAASSSAAPQDRPSTIRPPLVGSAAPTSTDRASTVARPTSPPNLSRAGNQAVSSVATPNPRPSKTQDSSTLVPSPQSGLPVGKDVLVGPEAERRSGPPARKSPDSTPVDVSAPTELTPPIPAPPTPSRPVFASQPQASTEADGRANAEASATQAEGHDHHEPVGSRSKPRLVQKLTKRRWVLFLAGFGVLGLLVLGLTKCSSEQSSKANNPDKPNKPNKTSSSVETTDPNSPNAAPKIIQRTVVGGRDTVGNGSIATDAITQTPRGATVFADGRKLISDASSVRIIGRDGRIRALLDPTGLLQKPGAATPFGNDIVVIDQASAALVRIKADGTVTQLSNDDQFRSPSSVTQFDDKTLVVADPGAGTLFIVAVNGDSAGVSPFDVNPPLLRPTAVTHRGDQVLAVVDDADGAIYEVTKGTSRKIAQARSQRVGVSDPMTVNTSDVEAISSPSTEVVSDQTTAISTDTTTAAVDEGLSEFRSATTASAVLTLPEPVVAITSRRDGSLWVLGRTSTLLLIAADNRGIPSVVSQSLNWPQGLGVDARGQALVADTGAHKVSAIDEKGAITNLAGAIHSPAYEANTTAADDLTLQSAAGFATTGTGDLYVADESANTIWGITAGGASYRLVGNGTRAAGSDGGQGPDTPTAAPTSLATAPDGSTYFAEPSTGRVRKVDTKGIVSTVFDQFGGPITLPEVAPPAPAMTSADESAGNPADPAAPAIAPTTTAPPSPEVLQEHRRGTARTDRGHQQRNTRGRGHLEGHPRHHPRRSLCPKRNPGIPAGWVEHRHPGRHGDHRRFRTQTH
jgi:hypothetical protein